MVLTYPYQIMQWTTWTGEGLGLGRAGSLSSLYRRCDREVNGAPSESVARVSKTVDLGIGPHTMYPCGATIVP